MKHISRRHFLKLCAASGAAAGLSQLWVPSIAQALGAAVKGNPPVIWIQGSGCGGCSASLINSVHPGIRELIMEVIGLSFHPGLMSYGSPMEVARKNKGKFILVIEGAVPRANNGAFNFIGEDSSGNGTALIDLLKNLGGMAGSVVAVGTCASYGGVSAADPDDGNSVGIETIIDTGKVINIPGCPPHPDWIVGTLSHILLFGKPELDDFGRPKVFYQGLIHNNCPRRQHFDNSIFARKLGDEGCMLLLGCKGPLTFGDCPTRLWNNGASWCVEANAPCIGCTDPGFPDSFIPFDKKMPEIEAPGITATADTIGVGLGIATVGGIAAHLTGSYIVGRVGVDKKTRGDQRDE